VDRDYAFPDANNPWSEEFPEVKNYNNLSGNELHSNFVAIKVGDVNCNARANSLTSVDGRTFHGSLLLSTKEQAVTAGEEFSVSFTASENVQGYQFTMNYDNKSVELVDIVEGVAKEGNFHVLSEGVITTSWNGEEAVAGATMFTVVFRARVNAQVSELMSVSSEYTVAEAYNKSGELMQVALDFSGAVVGSGFELYQNSPNPFKGETSIGFNLPEASTATLSITDVSGKVVKVMKGEFAKGYNEVTLKRSELGVSNGVLSYQLDTPTHSATKKMIIIE
jgi:hypothetical protein